MPFSRATLSQLRAQAQSDVGSVSLLRFSNLRVLADVLAYGFNALYGYLDWISKQGVPFTASDEYLEAWAALKGLTRKPATLATGSVRVSGTVGTVIPSNTLISRLDGFLYATTGAQTIGSSASAVVGLVSTLAGASGNADSSTPLTIQTAISGVSSVAVNAPITGGADVETDDELRTRMLLAYSQPPQGGALVDYLGWAEGVAGVTRAWIAPGGMGPGTVVCYFMMDDAEASHGGFPQGSNGVAAGETRDTPAVGDQLAVANAIFANCNVTTLVYSVAPLPNTINMTISGLSGATTAVQNAVRAAIAAVLLGKGSPAGVRLIDGSTGGTVHMSDINAAINSVAGASGFVVSAVTASAGSASPTTNITSNTGCLPVLGTVTFA